MLLDITSATLSAGVLFENNTGKFYSQLLNDTVLLTVNI